MTLFRYMLYVFMDRNRGNVWALSMRVCDALIAYASLLRFRDVQ